MLKQKKKIQMRKITQKINQEKEWFDEKKRIEKCRVEFINSCNNLMCNRISCAIFCYSGNRT